MKPWFISSPPSTQSESGTRQTPSYLETYTRLPGLAVTYYSYLMRTGPHDFLTVAYLDRDEIFNLMEQQFTDPKLGQVYAKTYRETWPALFEMLDNTVAGKLSKGALIRIADPDSGDQIWAIGTGIGNIDLNQETGTPEAALTDQRFTHAHTLVIQACAKVIGETLNRKPNQLKLFLRGSIAGAAYGQKIANDLEATWMPVLKTLVGTG